MKEKKSELPKGAVMSEEMACLELEKWFDFRRTKDRIRNNPDENLGYDPTRQALVDGFMYGLLTLNENGTLNQKLEFPVNTKESGETVISELNWKLRIQQKDINEQMKGVSAKETSMRMAAYIAAATGVNKAQLISLDSSDYGLSQAINNYFLA